MQYAGGPTASRYSDDARRVTLNGMLLEKVVYALAVRGTSSTGTLRQAQADHSRGVSRM